MKTAFGNWKGRVMQWLIARLREPSTYLGLGTTVAAAGAAFKINEAPQIADTMNGVGQAVAAGVPWYVWGPFMLGGILGAVIREKKR